MKLALLGYGKMGKMIEKVALERGHEIKLVVDIHNAQDLNPENLGKVDVAIDFTTPDVAYRNIMACFSADKPVVSGTTGWLEKWDTVVKYCKENNQTLFYASNFSPGVNVFFHTNRKLAQLMNQFDNYEATIEEIHHIHKLDAPSGTAITLALDIVSLVDRKKRWELNKTADNESIKITALREDEIPGTHIITWESEEDMIEIKHVAKGRRGFAVGAVLAAEFLSGKKGIFTMDDLLQL